MKNSAEVLSIVIAACPPAISLSSCPFLEAEIREWIGGHQDPNASLPPAPPSEAHVPEKISLSSQSRESSPDSTHRLSPSLDDEPVTYKQIKDNHALIFKKFAKLYQQTDTFLKGKAGKKLPKEKLARFTKDFLQRIGSKNNGKVGVRFPPESLRALLKEAENK